MDNEFIVCQKCGEQNPTTSNYCAKCARPLKEGLSQLNQPKKKKGKGYLTALGIVVAAAVLIIIITVSNGGDKPISTDTSGDKPAPTSVSEKSPFSTLVSSSTSTSKTTAAPTDIPKVASGIDGYAFYESVSDEIAKIDTSNVISKIETKMNSTNTDIAYVLLYLSDLSYWSGTDLTNKEFINTMGTLMDKIGIILNPNATIETQIYSPNGLLLGTRTLLGDVKLEN